MDADPPPPAPLGSARRGAANAAGAISPLFVPSRPEGGAAAATATAAAAAPINPALFGLPAFDGGAAAAPAPVLTVASKPAPAAAPGPAPAPMRGLVRFGPGSRMRLGPGGGQR
jgi:hypothetical protein